MKCSVCLSEVQKETNCENCNPINRKNWSRKLTIFLAGSVSVYSLVAVLFLVAFLAISMAKLGSGMTPFASLGAALGVTLLGLGGNISASLFNLASAEVMFPNLLVPIVLLAIMRYIVGRFLNRDSKSVSNALMFTLGAASAIFPIGLAVGLLAVTGGSLGASAIVPLIVVSLSAYVTFAGVGHWPLLERVSEPVKQQIRGLRTFHVWLLRIAVVAASYYALTMGTGLNSEWSLWLWPLAGVAALLFMPTLAFLAAPFFFGVALAQFDVFVAAQSLASIQGWQNDGQWLAWLIVSFAILFALISSVSSAAQSKPDRNNWWRSTAIGVVLATVTAYLSTVTASAAVAQGWLSNVLPTELKPEVLLLVVVFAAIGLVRGLMTHPSVHGFVVNIWATSGSIYRQAVSRISPRNHLLGKKVVAFFSDKHIVAAKLAKYSAVLALIGFFYLAGKPLAAITSPFYDNEGTATGNFSSALKSGESKNVEQYFNGVSGRVDAVIASSGLENDGEVSVAKQNTIESTNRISWSNNAYFIEVTSVRSSTKPAFWSLIPQWDAHVSSSKLPRVEATFGKNKVTSVIYKGRRVDLSRIFFLPGNVKWTPEGDKSKFVTAKPLAFDSSKNMKLAFEYSLNADKKDALKASVLKSFENQYTCDAVSMKTPSKAVLGKFSNMSGLPEINLSGSGTCDAGAYFGQITFNYDAVGGYSATESIWTWTFKFK